MIFHTQSKRELLATLARGACGDIALIEGSKGLHDGVDVAGRDSFAALARLTRSPVVLAIDAFGMARGVAPRLQIAGVIVNRVGPERQVAKLRAAIERYAELPVFGAVGRDEGLALRERRLGLIAPGETAGADAVVNRVAQAIARGVDLGARLAVAARAPALPPSPPLGSARAGDLRIAVARDDAFGFYYADDLDALRRHGAELIFFDALHEVRLLACNGRLIGGGFPVTRGVGVSAEWDGVRVGAALANFNHLRDASRCRWTRRFVDFVRRAPPASRWTPPLRAAPTPRRGRVLLFGAGPGDPELLTLRALRMMGQAEVVLYDRLADASVLGRIPECAERIYVGKRRNDHELTQDEIGKLMARLARSGKTVLRLKGGDPLMFGRGGGDRFRGLSGRDGCGRGLDLRR